MQLPAGPGTLSTHQLVQNLPTGGSTGDSSCNQLSNSSKLLPFNVTPPRKDGPSEAERKLEALTKQLEEEMEKEEEQGEFFGRYSKSHNRHPDF